MRPGPPTLYSISFILSHLRRPAPNRNFPHAAENLAESVHRASLGGLVLVVVVDAVVPEQGLVTVAPGEVLGADVLVGVLDALLQRRHMRPVLPMLVPQVVGVGGCEQNAGEDTAVSLC